MAGSPKTEITGHTVGTLFAETLKDIRASIPPGVSGAVDLKVTFKSVQLSTKGFNLVYVNQSENSSTLQIDLTTRIHTDDRPQPSRQEIIQFVQLNLRDESIYHGVIDGLPSIMLDKAIEESLSKRFQGMTAGPDTPRKVAIKRLTNSTDIQIRFAGYLQLCLYLPDEQIDGEIGPETLRCFANWKIDHPFIY